MNLIALRNEVLARGFDQGQYGARINQFINDGYNLICKRVNWYGEQATSDFNTAAGTSIYPWPTSMARMRSVHFTDRARELQFVTLRDIDRSPTGQTSTPLYYAIDGPNIHLYPTPDGIYPLEYRYWQLPNALAQDTDIPILPLDWHWLLWKYATAECFKADDDATMGQYWQAEFNSGLAMFAADVKFPDTDGPTQARGMWEDPTILGVTDWTLGAWY